MRSAILFILALAFCGSYAFAQARVELKGSTEMAQAGQFNYSFDLIDTKTHKSISDGDLAVEMEKKLHMIVYDSSLMEFQHVHPEFDGTTWRVKMNFAVNGNYWIWAQGVLKDGKVDFSSPSKLMVMGGSPAWPTTPVLGDVRSGTVDISVVTLSGASLAAGAMVMLDVKFTRNDGTTPQLTPYLGAFAHVVAVPSSGETLQHVHVMNVSADEGMLHTTFPAIGDYRLWIQFIDNGLLKVVPLSVSVTK